MIHREDIRIRDPFDQQSLIAFHAPNDLPNERPMFHPIEEKEGLLVLKNR